MAAGYKISVIINVSKREGLVRCLNSVLRQKIDDAEIIIVKAEETDVDDITGHVRSCRYAESVREAVKNAAAGYVLICSGTDFFVPDILKQLLNEAIKNSSDLVVAQTGVRADDVFVKKNSYSSDGFDNSKKHLLPAVYRDNGGKIYKKELMLKAGYKDGSELDLIQFGMDYVSCCDKILVSDKIMLYSAETLFAASGTAAKPVAEVKYKDMTVQSVIRKYYDGQWGLRSIIKSFFGWLSCKVKRRKRKKQAGRGVL